MLLLYLLVLAFDKKLFHERLSCADNSVGTERQMVYSPRTWALGHVLFLVSLNVRL